MLTTMLLPSRSLMSPHYVSNLFSLHDYPNSLFPLNKCDFLQLILFCTFNLGASSFFSNSTIKNKSISVGCLDATGENVSVEQLKITWTLSISISNSWQYAKKFFPTCHKTNTSMVHLLLLLM